MNGVAGEKILVVDDEQKMCDFLEIILSEDGYDVSSVTSGEEALKRMREEDFDVVITDLMMPGIDGMQLLERVRELNSDAIVIMITGYSTVETAVEAMKKGAYDYIPKPFKIEEVKVVIRKAIDQRRIIRENRRLKDELKAARGKFSGIVGNSRKMQEIYQLIEKVAKADSTVLIRGESGTGKELVARALHHYSPRSEKPFVSINCAALPENLLESELFGHARGAFTGAVTAKRGLFEEADSGTVFLDEIGDISLALQAKLLRFLQNREFIRVGETTTRRVDVRVIVATNRDLEAAIEKGTFRRDLFYRLNVISITLPPLRERKDDIPLLAKHFAGKVWERMGKGPTRFSQEAMEALVAYDWPGNVRELENVVERAMILGEGSVIRVEDLPEEVRRAWAAQATGARAPGDASYRAPGGDNLPGEAGGGTALSEGVSFKEAVEAYQRRLILEALEESGWVQARAAERLGMGRTTLNEIIKRLGIPTEPPAR